MCSPGRFSRESPQRLLRSVVTKKRIRSGGTFVLDHDPKCQCGNYATVFMVIHRIDDCFQEETLGSFMCDQCVEAGVKSIERVCELGGEVCVTCGLELVTPSDVIVRVQPLRLDQPLDNPPPE